MSLKAEKGGSSRDADQDAKSRRQFLREAALWIGKGVGITTLVGAANVIPWVLRSSNIGEDQTRQEQDGAAAIEHGLPLEVKYFAKNITDAAIRLVNDTSTEDNIGMLGGYFAGTGLGGFLLRNRSKQDNGRIGVASILTARTVDVISTYVAAEKIGDPRFAEYGLNVYFFEGNPFLSANPTPKELTIKAIGFSVLAAYSGYRFPSFGRGYLGAVPFIAHNNLGVATAISKCIDLGDEVKQMIEQGETADEIKGYLDHIQGEQNGVPQSEMPPSSQRRNPQE